MKITIMCHGREKDVESNGVGIDSAYFPAPAYDFYCDNDDAIAYDASTVVFEDEETALEYADECYPVYFCRAGGGAECDFVVYLEADDDDDDE